MTDSTRTSDGILVPQFLYGTAWKEDRTQQLTELAIRTGFRGIDTANQRRHYHEAAVGQAVAAVIREGLVQRDELFLQTKFTFLSSQDHRLPYDPGASTEMQVQQSFDKSREHLGVDVVDSYLLHGPSRRDRLVPADWAAWRAIEALHERGDARRIGVSNFSLPQLEALCQDARVSPHFVQNRCYATTCWDREIRQFCAARSIRYQGFSLLTANRQLLAHPPLVRIAQRHGLLVTQLLFRFALDAGMIALTGTTNADHMRADLNVLPLRLTPEEFEIVERSGAAARQA